MWHILTLAIILNQLYEQVACGRASACMFAITATEDGHQVGGGTWLMKSRIREG